MSKKKLPVSKRPWVEENGSIYTADTQELTFEFSKRTVQVRTAIAFNVGTEVAKHIVEVHNESLR
jgi:hypothetical protein